eukprot:TRINITY_DN10558_c0_g1_i1.p1 TRINITY_DN10558_c0_g1~~TRINITY_DN10558_c0_g1_i1.p1  ORF type:complete len:1504 (+),score=332.97 TRINITY_DN10558_c0_g1_i1:186-4697(+)
MDIETVDSVDALYNDSTWVFFDLRPSTGRSPAQPAWIVPSKLLRVPSELLATTEAARRSVAEGLIPLPDDNLRPDRTEQLDEVRPPLTGIVVFGPNAPAVAASLKTVGYANVVVCSSSEPVDAARRRRRLARTGGPGCGASQSSMSLEGPDLSMYPSVQQLTALADGSAAGPSFRTATTGSSPSDGAGMSGTLRDDTAGAMSGGRQSLTRSTMAPTAVRSTDDAGYKGGPRTAHTAGTLSEAFSQPLSQSFANMFPPPLASSAAAPPSTPMALASPTKGARPQQLPPPVNSGLGPRGTPQEVIASPSASQTAEAAAALISGGALGSTESPTAGEKPVREGSFAVSRTAPPAPDDETSGEDFLGVAEEALPTSRSPTIVTPCMGCQKPMSRLAPPAALRGWGQSRLKLLGALVSAGGTEAGAETAKGKGQPHESPRQAAAREMLARRRRQYLFNMLRQNQRAADRTNITRRAVAMSRYNIHKDLLLPLTPAVAAAFMRYAMVPLGCLLNRELTAAMISPSVAAAGGTAGRSSSPSVVPPSSSSGRLFGMPRTGMLPVTAAPGVVDVGAMRTVEAAYGEVWQQCQFVLCYLFGATCPHCRRVAMHDGRLDEQGLGNSEVGVRRYSNVWNAKEAHAAIAGSAATAAETGSASATGTATTATGMPVPVAVAAGVAARASRAGTDPDADEGEIDSEDAKGDKAETPVVIGACDANEGDHSIFDAPDALSPAGVALGDLASLSEDVVQALELELMTKVTYHNGPVRVAPGSWTVHPPHGGFLCHPFAFPQTFFGDIITVIATAFAVDPRSPDAHLLYDLRKRRNHEGTLLLCGLHMSGKLRRAPQGVRDLSFATGDIRLISVLCTASLLIHGLALAAVGLPYYTRWLDDAAAASFRLGLQQCDPSADPGETSSTTSPLQGATGYFVSRAMAVDPPPMPPTFEPDGTAHLPDPPDDFRTGGAWAADMDPDSETEVETPVVSSSVAAGEPDAEGSRPGGSRTQTSATPEATSGNDSAAAALKREKEPNLTEASSFLSRLLSNLPPACRNVPLRQLIRVLFGDADTTGRTPRKTLLYLPARAGNIILDFYVCDLLIEAGHRVIMAVPTHESADHAWIEDFAHDWTLIHLMKQPGRRVIREDHPLLHRTIYDDRLDLVVIERDARGHVLPYADLFVASGNFFRAWRMAEAVIAHDVHRHALASFPVTRHVFYLGSSATPPNALSSSTQASAADDVANEGGGGTASKSSIGSWSAAVDGVLSDRRIIGLVDEPCSEGRGAWGLRVGGHTGPCGTYPLVALQPKERSAPLITRRYIDAKADAFIQYLYRAKKHRGHTVVFGSCIIGSLGEAQVPTTIAIAKFMQQTFHQTDCYKRFLPQLPSSKITYINPATGWLHEDGSWRVHWEPGFDGDAMMEYWSQIQMSGLLDIWYFQAASDIRRYFEALPKEDWPPDWADFWARRDWTDSKGCMQEMLIARDVKRKHPDLIVWSDDTESLKISSEDLQAKCAYQLGGIS